ncbi:hypothetical protein MSTO_39060 [Mycobacterium stomatepiae]|uniref:Uncharacterized protein n=1 Tax=Mycobacterium stomatepiae TaxID=470076 RepID=A0A7I7QC16_9MYCO|nr:hypothetical protein MSTO_39060 [Mycobacterium stomatepiae]
MPVIDAAARMVYLFTGGRDSLTRNRAADRFATMIAPCVAHPQQVWIDGQSIYRLSGNRGTAPFFNVTVQGARVPGPGVLHEPFGDTRRPICSADNSASATTANSRSTSVDPNAAPTGCLPPSNRESCSSGRDSTAGTSGRRDCASRGST